MHNDYVPICYLVLYGYKMIFAKRPVTLMKKMGQKFAYS